MAEFDDDWHGKFVPAFAIIRQDTWRDMSRAMIEEVITVKKVVATQEIAEQEVERLTKLNAGKGSKYWWSYTRLFMEESAEESIDT